MIIRSRAPLRISFGGGGTEIDPYRTNHGGEVLSTTISLYAYATIIDSPNNNSVTFKASDLSIIETYKIKEILSNKNIFKKSKLAIHVALYIEIIKILDHYVNKAIEIITFCDAPPGSGLGSSSTLTVAMIQAYNRKYNLKLNKDEIAQKAFYVERIILGLKGGQQDQYSASFGGFNHLFFKKNGKVIVEPLKISNNIKCEFEASLILLYTGISRESGSIIERQIIKDSKGDTEYLHSLNKLKKLTLVMKNALLKNNIAEFGSLLHDSWLIKRNLSSLVSNSVIDKLYDIARSNGAYGGKISGAGGGGFFTIICNPFNRGNIKNELIKCGLEPHSISISKKGAENWNVSSR